jgi:ribosomal protein S13
MKEIPTYKHGFKIPEGYLASFETKLQERLIVEKNKSNPTELKPVVKIHRQESTQFSFQKIVGIGISIAACIALFISVQNTNQTNNIEGIAITTIEDYLFSNTEDFSVEEISTELPENIIDDILLEQTILDETLEVYLLEILNNNSLIL